MKRQLRFWAREVASVIHHKYVEERRRSPVFVSRIYAHQSSHDDEHPFGKLGILFFLIFCCACDVAPKISQQIEGFHRPGFCVPEGGVEHGDHKHNPKAIAAGKGREK
ncbi:hypothetical protein C4D60_Mb01t31810 [Musa balbisiana]|uniref:Uncharacterized protein n=1 Tax=Musa balbisiana TaxID=52838 RepID=A0A4S8JS78_MUSBA|nr:hypothetical protein C4D60_Mb01t31810 [Musa balbisiana]